MSARDDFNNILTGRAAWEKALGTPTASQWAEWTGNILACPDVNRLAVTTGAATLLSFTWSKLRDQREQEWISGPAAQAWLPDVYPWLGPLDKLLAPTAPPQTDADVEARLAAFAASGTKILDEQQAKASAEDPVLGAGILASAGVPWSGLPACANGDWPDISLLWSQAQPLAPFIKAVGRPTGAQPWAEWFVAQFDAFKRAIPGLAQMGAWAGLSKLINDQLAMGLIPVLGMNVITFGSNLLTPLKALIDFPVFMKRQALLYRLHEYGAKGLKLPEANPVMKAIANAISSVDWAAIRIAFQMTPASLLISVYSGVKFLTVKAKPSAGSYYAGAQALINIADTIKSGETAENRLALMVIMHLAGSYDSYIKIMTEQVNDAYSDLSAKMDL